MIMAARNNFAEAFDLLRPTALTGVSSPFYEAALYCQENTLYNEAISLLSAIPKDHWQFDDAMKLMHNIYQRRIAELEADNLRLRAIDPAPIATSKPKNTSVFFEEIFNKLKNNHHNNLASNAKNSVLTFSFSQKPAGESEKKAKTPDKRNERTMKLDS